MRVESVSGFRLIWPVHAIAVDGAGPKVFDVAVPDFVGEFRKVNAFDFDAPGIVEQAQLDPGGVGREQAEVDAAAVARGALRLRTPCADAAFGNHWAPNSKDQTSWPTRFSARSTSATLHACAMQPRGVYGGSASKISLTEPTPASLR